MKSEGVLLGTKDDLALAAYTALPYNTGVEFIETSLFTNVRVIYYFKKRNDEIWMLTIYGKSDVENIPAHVLKQIAEEIKDA